MEAYVLVKTEGGNIKGTIEGIRKLKGVKEVNAVTGPFDLIVVVEGKDIDEIGEVVATRIRGIKGVKDTLTCIKVSLK